MIRLLKRTKNHFITVRLETGTLMILLTVSIVSAVKILDFESIKRCYVLDLDSGYDLIFGMARLECQETWIDWRSKTLSADRIVPTGSLMSHEPTPLENKSAI